MSHGSLGASGQLAGFVPVMHGEEATMTATPTISRRTLVKHGGAALAGLSVLRLAGPAHAFQTPPSGEVVPWLD